MDRLNGEVTLIQISKPKPRPENEENPAVRNTVCIENPTESLKFQCPVCFLCFATRNEAEIHENSHVNVSKSNETVTSDYVYISDGEATGKDLLPHKCEVCFKGFRTPYHLNRHFRTHTKNIDSETNYNCAVCNDFFIDKSEFVTHMQIHMNLKRRIGEDTEIIYKSKPSLEESTSTHNIVDYEVNKVSNKSGHSPHLCNYCLKTFKTIQALRTHEKTHKPKCPVCPSMYFETSEEFEVHNLNFHGGSPIKIEKTFTAQDYEIITLPKKRPQSTGVFDESGSIVCDTSYRNYSEPALQCEYCDKKCKTPQALKSHLKSHPEHNEYYGAKKMKITESKQTSPNSGQYPCDSCEKIFKSTGALHTHKKVHQDAEYLMIHSCDICLKVFKTKCALTSHVKIHQNKCSQCQEIFESEELLRHHEEGMHEIEKEDTTEKNQDLSCDTCFKVFKNTSSLKKHEKTHQTQCQHCSKYFESEATLKLHEYNEHFLVIKNKIAPDIQNIGQTPQSSNKPSCDVCFKEFKNSAGVKNHQAATHVKCQHCFKYFESEETLKLHEYSEHFFSLKSNEALQSLKNSSSVIIYCTVCLKEFVNRGALKNHEKIHKVQCKACLKYFDSEEVLRVHMVCKHTNEFNNDEIAVEDWSKVSIKTENDPQDIKPKVEDLKKTSKKRCKLCPKVFKTSSALLAHSKIHATPELKVVLNNIKKEENQVPKKPKSTEFKCDICLKTFVNLIGLLSHKKSHKVECKICLKQFGTNNALIRHKLVHKNICEHCSKQCKSEKSLRCHLLKQHPEKMSKDSATRIKSDKKEKTATNTTVTNTKEKAKKDSTPAKITIIIKKEKPDESTSESTFKTNSNSKPVFSCKECPLKFKKKFLYDSHMSSHKPKCQKCSKVCLNHGLLTIHMKKEHMIKLPPIAPPEIQVKTKKKKVHNKQVAVDPNTCKVCNKKFKKRSALICHEKVHKPKCIQCMETFETAAEYKLHEEKMHLNCKKIEPMSENLLEQILKKENTTTEEEQSNEYFCNICLRVFRSKSALTSHEKLHQNDNFNSDVLFEEDEDDDLVINSCIMCQKVFKTRSALISHLKAHQNGESITVEAEENTPVVNDNINTPHDSNNSNNVCDTCYKVCKNKQALLSHLKSHRVKCRKCGRYFENKDFLKVHQNEDHQKEEDIPEIKIEPEEILNMIHSCSSCFKTFKSKAALATHLKTHHIKCTKCNTEFETKELYELHYGDCGRVEQISNQPSVTEATVVTEETVVPAAPIVLHKCEICQKEFLKNTALISHKKSHRKQCKKCPKIFESKSLLREHVKAEHKDELKGFICLSCDKYFKTKQELEDHKASHSHTEELNFKCKICDKGFKIKKQLFAHKATVHPKLPRFKCTQCPKEFKFKPALENHIKNRHTEERNFTCNICGSTFKLKQALQNHEKTHVDEKEFECVVCHKKFKLKQQLQTHALTHINIRPFGCNLCPRAFKLKQQLENHVQAVHLDERPFTCDICDKRFQFKQQLLVHTNVHFDTKDFQCELCLKYFSTKQNLDTHMKVHNDLKDFECDVCEVRFRTKQQRDVHRAAKHSEQKILNEDLKAAFTGHTMEEPAVTSEHQKSIEETIQGVQDEIVRGFQESFDQEHEDNLDDAESKTDNLAEKPDIVQEVSQIDVIPSSEAEDNVDTSDVQTNSEACLIEEKQSAEPAENVEEKLDDASQTTISYGENEIQNIEAPTSSEEILVPLQKPVDENTELVQSSEAVYEDELNKSDDYVMQNLDDSVGDSGTPKEPSTVNVLPQTYAPSETSSTNYCQEPSRQIEVQDPYNPILTSPVYSVPQDYVSKTVESESTNTTPDPYSPTVTSPVYSVSSQEFVSKPVEPETTNATQESNRQIDVQNPYSPTLVNPVYSVPHQDFVPKSVVESERTNTTLNEKPQHVKEQNNLTTFKRGYTIREQDNFEQGYDVSPEPQVSQDQLSETSGGNSSTTSKQQNMYKPAFTVQTTNYGHSGSAMYSTDYRNEEQLSRSIYKPRFSMMSNNTNRIQEQQSYLSEPNNAQEFQTLNVAPSTIYKPRFNLLIDSSNRTFAQEQPDFVNIRTASQQQQIAYNLEQLQQSYLQQGIPVTIQMQQNQYVDLDQGGSNRYINVVPYDEQENDKYNRDNVQYKPYQ